MADNGKRNTTTESLPADRKAAVEAGLAHYQLVSAERDKLMGEIAHLRSDMAALKVVAEAQKSQMTDMESRMASMTAVRDQAVAERAKYETLFVSFQAMLRAFKVPAAPLIREIEDNEGNDEQPRHLDREYQSTMDALNNKN